MLNQTETENNYRKIVSLLPEHVKLIAVSKTHPPESIKQIYDLGHRRFGENKVQEMVEKQAVLPHDIKWHLIGHLQRNKVKYIAGFVDTIQSVDSEKILQEIDKQANKHNRIIKVLLQLKIAKEDTKFGLDENTAEKLLQEYSQGKFPNVKVTGLMGMATFTDNPEDIRKEFLFLKGVFDRFCKTQNLSTLSMGMSDDFLLAVECGSNSVRIGSAIFGHRAATGPL